MTLKLRIILVGTILVLVVLATSGMIISSLNDAEDDADIINALGRQRMLSQAMAKSALGYSSRGEYKILKNQTIVLNNYITQMRAMYTKHVIPAAKKAGIDISMTPESGDAISVPFPATLTRLVNEKFGKIKDMVGREISVDIIAEIPVNPQKGYTTEMDVEAGEFLENNPKKVFNTTLEENGNLYLLFYTADVATVNECATCHSSISGKDFKAGDMLGIRKFKMLFSSDIAEGTAQLRPSLDEYKTAKAVFAKTLSAIRNGGEYPLNLEMTKIKRVGRINDEIAREKVGEIGKKFMDFSQAVDRLINAGDDSGSFNLRKSVLVESNNLRKLSDDLVTIYNNIANINQTKIYRAAAVASILVILITVGMAAYLIFAVIVPINNTAESLKDIAEGQKDLTRRLPDARTDEIGELAKWFNIFVTGLYDLIDRITGITNNLASSANEMSQSAEESYKGTEKQSVQVSEVAASMEEMSSTISEVAQSSFAVSESAKKASDAASKGETVVTQAIEGMGRIESSVKESSGIIEELGKSSQQIDEIVNVINDIADQTNLLALNAAIEAARAGEQGRGFAVVADEVRKLAERTTKATKEISNMIQDIQTNTLKAVSSMEGGTRDVADGVRLIHQAGESLKNIMAMIHDVTDNIEEIAASSEEQTTTAEAVSRNTSMVSEVSGELAAAAKESSKTIKDVSQMAEQLKEIVQQFKL